MTNLIAARPHKWSYRAGVISFAEGEQPSDEEPRQVIDRFEELAFAGLDSDRYACKWVRYTHEDHVELHFRIPRVELQSGRSLNIALPGFERAFDSLRDLMNKEHDWADLMDAARTAEPKQHPGVHASCAPSIDPQILVFESCHDLLGKACPVKRCHFFDPIFEADRKHQHELKRCVFIHSNTTEEFHPWLTDNLCPYSGWANGTVMKIAPVKVILPADVGASGVDRSW